MENLEFEIDGYRYIQTPLPTKVAFGIEAKLLKTLGPGAKSALDAVLAGQVADDTSAALIYGLAETLPDVDPDVLWGVAVTLADHTTWVNEDGAAVPLKAGFSGHFATVADLARLHKFVWVSLKEQFGPFLAGFGISLKAAPAPKSSRRKKSTGGTGQS